MKKITLKKTSLFLVIMVLISAVFSPVCLAEEGVNEIVLTGDGAQFSCSGVSMSGGVLTIGAPGIYSLSGSLANGQILVNVGKEERVTLVLNGVSLSCGAYPAIYLENADRLVIELAPGTENTVTSGTPEMLENYSDTNSGAAIYGKDDIRVQGSGTLTVNGYINNGIATKNDLDINGSKVTVTAANNALKGTGSVEITDSYISVSCGNTAIRSDSSKTDKGYVNISGTSLVIASADDVIKASGPVVVIPTTPAE